ncbi:glutathione peroxidase [uncultured Tateyamaria sp.]|uniref:glutathione peroxidase n=1 Tax=uncultured Tateyamaria sp. TaxID=455651 RepID=UPI00261863A2|nr:glutathione peroxidase [uncultured Tateyamaria sp.]
MRGIFAVVVWLWACVPGWAGITDISLPSIDGGDLRLSEMAGQPILIVNTASQCAFTDQYRDLQALYDQYRDDGLVVIAVPSDDFRQELDDAEAVRAFCEMTYGIDMPMTDILSVKGAGAHPLYLQIKAQSGFVPRWNFNKVLIAPDGTVAATWGSRTAPMSRDIRRAVEAMLPQG